MGATAWGALRGRVRRATAGKGLPAAAVCAAWLAGLFGADAAQAGRLELAPVAGLDVESFVIDAVALPGQPDRIVLLEYSGRVVIADRATGTSQVMLDSLVVGGEDLASVYGAGAFSIALAPDFASSGKFYVSANTRGWDNVLVEFTSTGGVADPGSQRRVLTIERHPQAEIGAHFGGAISFDDAGMLFMTTGDHNAPFGPGTDNPSRDVASRLGKVLRIDPAGDAYPDDPANNYAIPAGNPDFGPGADPALWAVGLRNPFKGKYDPVSGLFFVADVGEDAREEVDLIEPGGDYGWAVYEGSSPREGAAPPGLDLVDPVFDYDWSGGDARASITGGLVYHGPLAALDGRYLFGDYLGWGATGDGPPVWSLDVDGPGAPQARLWETTELSGDLARTMGFAQDEAGRLYLFDEDGDVFEVRSAAVPLPAAAGLLTAAAGLLAAAGTRRRGRPGRRDQAKAAGPRRAPPSICISSPVTMRASSAR
ncbi:PQQ-dependent sugar dehydrogenase [Albimonas sp. CAU 1670]|uniref:PQQ-dependent sugar dehydrogenase n=1 Tax=Albimonas sp. CAU 1670 TaxID=3032599 RepID=UPI0023D9CE57|nr:PQQ-dependent sugar dehydrogenase [Albimonas sp. CAU 1670]MDF2234218.1 PQQ-dependent sugar dehydrogenase [Albimonas sp. CAU 1670]